MIDYSFLISVNLVDVFGQTLGWFSVVSYKNYHHSNGHPIMIFNTQLSKYNQLIHVSSSGITGMIMMLVRRYLIPERLYIVIRVTMIRLILYIILAKMKKINFRYLDISNRQTSSSFTGFRSGWGEIILFHSLCCETNRQKEKKISGI